MMNKEQVTNRLFTHAVFPVIKVVLDNDPMFKKMFLKVKARVAVKAEGQGAVLCFNSGNFSLDYVELERARSEF